MGKTLDALLGRSFRPSKFRTLANLAISRLAVFKNKKQSRYAISRSDVVQLLHLGEHERALIRVEQVIKERNMLDAYTMIEGYCIILSERVKVIEHVKVCPDELKEAISSIIFAASRCGEFPELQEMRRVFTSRYGKEFACRATELRNNCGVNTTLIQKLSTRQPSLESRRIALQEIAGENDIKLQLPSTTAVVKKHLPLISGLVRVKLYPNEGSSRSRDHQSPMEKVDEGKTKQPELVTSRPGDLDSAYLGVNLKNFPNVMDKAESFAYSVIKQKQYKHAADAAEEAFLSAVYAAAAARAAVELSRRNPPPPGNPGHNDPVNVEKQLFNANYEITSSRETKDRMLGLDKLNMVETYNLHSEDDEETIKSEGPQNIGIEQKNSRSYRSTTSPRELETDEQFQQEVKLDETNYETGNDKFNTVSIKAQWGESGIGLRHYSQEQTPSSIQGDLRTDDKLHCSEKSAVKTANWLNTEKKLMSVRTRR